MQNAYDVLSERGFVYQTTDEDGVRRLLGGERIACYIGFDPTAASFHVGSLVPIMALAHIQRSGHRPIAVVGGGTAMVGDPSGKTEMRQLLTRERIAENAVGLKGQLSRFITFGDDQAVMIDNGEWLHEIRYIDFLRDFGRHFSVNRMLTAESVKLRLETGLSFLEFNYMLLQAYDFYHLCRSHDCLLQMGGQDQWGNIVAGIELIRRTLQREAFGVTFPLLTDGSGQKFGKTEAGAVWLDPALTSPYAFYQFWRNTDDADVARLLGLFSFLPMEEVQRLARVEGNMLNRAKEILAFEVTSIVHSPKAAKEAYSASIAKFGLSDPEGKVETSSAIKDVLGAKEDLLPTVTLPAADLTEGIWAPKLFVSAGLCKSNGDARRLIQGGGAYINDQRVDAVDLTVGEDMLEDGALTLRAGKKRYCRVVFE